MICDRIRIVNFRNIEEADVSFSPGVNVLWGSNAQGKTNLLEAIRLSGNGKSFRATKEAEMVRFGCEVASVSLDYHDAKRFQNLTARIFTDARHRQVTQNGVRLTRLSDMVGAFRTVLFCPEHLGLIKDGPAARRNFLDTALCTMRPLYLVSLQKYNDVLKARNALLKNAAEDAAVRRTAGETLDVWSAALAHEAAFIAVNRKEYVDGLRICMHFSIPDMTGGREEVTVQYLGPVGPAIDYEDDYKDQGALEARLYELFTSNLDREIAAGTTLYGIHRDDFLVKLNDMNARLYASQGQQRSLALALKLAEGDILEKSADEMPVYLFDDVLSELDEERRRYLLSKMGDKQVIITSCEPSVIIGDGKNGTFREDGYHIIHVKDGSYTG